MQRILTRHFSSYKEFNKIPGPKCLPLLGNLHLYKLGILKISEQPRVLKHLYDKYGPIVKEKLGKDTIIHIFEPSDIKTVYHTEGKLPHVVPLQVTVQLYRSTKGLSLGLGNMNGEEWLRLRSAVQQFMLSPKEVSYFLPFVDKAAKTFIDRLISGTYNLRDDVAKWSLESAGYVCFEKSLGCFDESICENEAQLMVNANKIIFQLSGYLKYSLPIYYYIPTPKWTKLVEYEDFFYGAASRHVKEALNNLNKLKQIGADHGKYIFLSNLLKKQEVSGKDVEIITLSLFGDGLSTTTPFLLFCFQCLAENPVVQQKLRNEILSTLPYYNDEISYDIFTKLPYLKAFIKEVFRYYPNGTEISRILQKDLILSGYHVPAGTKVSLNPIVNFKAEKYFRKAIQFIPERWLRNDNKTNIDPYLLTPFGHGNRTCAGRRFAEQDLYVVLIRVLQKLKLSLTSYVPFEQVNETLLFPKHDMNIKFELLK